jgi:hypothetical protein
MSDSYIEEDNSPEQSSLSEASGAQNCNKTVHETVFIQAEVTVTPDVEIGDVKYFCQDSSVTKKHGKKPCPKKECTFEVIQKICVEIPLTFSATAAAKPKGIFCGTPQKGKCPKRPHCSFKFGFLKTVCQSILARHVLLRCLKKIIR